MRPRPLARSAVLLALLSLPLACTGSAAVAAAGRNAGEPNAAPAPRDVSAPAAGGDQLPVAVLPLGLTDETRRRYPQLSERNVGFGVHNLLVDLLYDTGRFRFVEDKPEVVQDLLDRQWVASTGAVDAGSAVAYGRLLGARYVVYGEVFDFGTRRVKRKVAETWISIQVRMVDVETSEYVPASGSGSVTVKDGLLYPTDPVEFARSTVGQATRISLEHAVPELLERFDRYLERGEAGR